MYDAIPAREVSESRTEPHLPFTLAKELADHSSCVILYWF